MQKASHATAHLFISDPYGEKAGGVRDWVNRLFLDPSADGSAHTGAARQGA